MTAGPDPAATTGGFGRTRIWYPSVGSTMEVAAGLAAAGAPHGTVVEAEYQSAGRGRMGRAWVAAPGSSLLTSWIMRIDGRAETHGVLSPLIALSVIRAIESLAPDAPVGFKWPNDVLVDERKIAGILLTSRPLGDGVVVVAGIGVNLDASDDDADESRVALRAWKPAVTTDQLRERIAFELGHTWQVFRAHGAIPLDERRELEARLVWLDHLVEVRLPDQVVSGHIVGIDRDGGLRLRRAEDAAAETLHVGEIERGPRKLRVEPPDSCRILPGAGRTSAERPTDRERHRQSDGLFTDGRADPGS